MTLLESIELVPLDALVRKIAKEDSIWIIDAVINGALVRLADGLRAKWGRHAYNDIQRIKTAAQRRLDVLIRQKDRSLRQAEARYMTEDPREDNEQVKTTNTSASRHSTGRRIRRVRRSDTGDTETDGGAET